MSRAKIKCKNIAFTFFFFGAPLKISIRLKREKLSHLFHVFFFFFSISFSFSFFFSVIILLCLWTTNTVCFAFVAGKKKQFDVSSPFIHISILYKRRIVCTYLVCIPVSLIWKYDLNIQSFPLPPLNLFARLDKSVSRMTLFLAFSFFLMRKRWNCCKTRGKK